MNTNSLKAKISHSRSILFALLIGALMLILTLCAALTITPGIATALVGVSSPTAHPISWSVAEIAKPTYTPSVQASPPSMPVADIAKPTDSPSVQESPLYLPTMEIVKPADSPSPEPVFIATQADPPTSLPSPDNTTSQITMNIVVDTRIAAPTNQVNGSDTLDPGQSYSGGKSILVSISQQHLTAYENGQVVYSFIASTGMRNSTKVGTFSVLDKIPNAYGATWNIWMPNWLGIYYVGSLEDGIHALPILSNGDRLWSGYLGTPISYGCVVLGVSESLQLYNWADVGTPVVIQR